MYDSLPYRNDAATIFRRLIRSLPTRSAVVGVATCDKGLPAMMMALAGTHDLPCVLVPGGVPCPVPSCAAAFNGRVHYRGYIDYALDCATNQFSIAWARRTCSSLT